MISHKKENLFDSLLEAKQREGRNNFFLTRMLDGRRGEGFGNKNVGKLLRIKISML